MQEYADTIEEIWKIRNELFKNLEKLNETTQLLIKIIDGLNEGTIRVSNKDNGIWIVNQWVKKAILLYFQTTKSKVYSGDYVKWYDKVSPKFPKTMTESEFQHTGSRIVPGAFIRNGCYLAKNVVVMPSFINMGAYIDEGSMIDTWATIGSCAQIGKDCHISGGAGVGGVLEPMQSNPVIIEDNCFIGARSEIVEGVIVESGAVIGMGVFIGASTKIVDRNSGKITYGKVPAYSVVVPGSLPSDNPKLPSLYCAVIIKQVDESTRSKTGINELLRE